MPAVAIVSKNPKLVAWRDAHEALHEYIEKTRLEMEKKAAESWDLLTQILSEKGDLPAAYNADRWSMEYNAEKDTIEVEEHRCGTTLESLRGKLPPELLSALQALEDSNDGTMSIRLEVDKSKADRKATKISDL
jgi:hypothetical protein